MNEENKTAAIIHPGAIGDCLLTLPLAEYLKKNCGFLQVHLIGNMDYISFYPTRTSIDRVRSMEMFEFHRLFVPEKNFHPDAKDPLIQRFSDYEHIISFLGNKEESFEKNLLFTLYCTHSAEVTMLPLAGPSNTHTSAFYLAELARLNEMEPVAVDLNSVFLRPLPSDLALGRDFLDELNISEQSQVCLISPGSGGKAKCWPAVNFIAVAKAIHAEGIEPIFLIGPVEQERFSQHELDDFKSTGHVLSELSLEQIVGILSSVDYFLGNDSGIGHLAGAMGTKTIIVFGPTNPGQYRPLGPRVIPVKANKQEDFLNHEESGLRQQVLSAICS